MNPLFLVPLLISAPAQSQAPEACLASWTQLSAALQRHSIQVEELSPELRANVEANANAMKPKTDVRLSHVFVARLGDVTRMVMVTDLDCVIAMPRLDEASIKELESPPGEGI